MKEAFLVIGGTFLLAGLIVGAVFFSVRHAPNKYLYCTPGWYGACIKSPTKLNPDPQGCVFNEEGKICDSYEVKYGKY